MKIIQVAAEIAPIAKVGGLADVVYGLSRALIAKGHEVSVVLPKYRTLGSIDLVPAGNALWRGILDDIPLFLIDSPLFNRDSIYHQPDDPERFLYFCRAVLELLHHMPTDILHMHDWHCGALSLLAREALFPVPKLVTTIHNFEHQGKGLAPPFDNLLRTAIINSDVINTVSPTYAQEVMNSGMGHGLEGLLKERKGHFRGILNGIDYDYWNLQTDPLLPVHDRVKLKKILRTQLNLQDKPCPIAAVIARLVPQKGIDLIKHALHTVLKKGGQFVLLGSSPIPQIQRDFEALQKKYQHHPDVHLTLHYDEKLSHLIYGGADLFLVPSLFEPCGLTQMIALHYGALPLVRHTGGLADTVKDVDHSGAPDANGFCFKDPYNQELDSAIERAFRRWFTQPDSWEHIQEIGMNQDFSWNASANQYLDMYAMHVV